MNEGLQKALEIIASEKATCTKLKSLPFASFDERRKAAYEWKALDRVEEQLLWLKKKENIV